MKVCTFPRNDTRRPECGREAVCEYVQGDVRLPRCFVHDSTLARLLADEMGMTRERVAVRITTLDDDG